MSDEKISENTSIDDLKQAGISSKLSEAQKAFLALKTTLDEEAINLIQEREAFESMRKKIDSVHFSKHIKLNVGGQVFKTSIDTLLKDPDSMLASMFSERFDVKPDKEDGAYFIDRDGTHFRLILNYLRTGELNYPKGNKIMAKELFLEAEFYQLIDIQKEVWPEIAFQKSSYIINTLNEEQKESLLSWLPTKSNFVSWVQLYSSVNHGWWSSSFHQRCDNQGPTVIIARSGNYIFGGYAEVPWKSDSSFVYDENAFLFTLANPTGAPPTKLAQTPGGTTGIYCHPSYGPTFGVGGNCGIYFMNSTNTSNCGVNNSYAGFVVPAGQVFSNFIYGNTTSFGMSHLEVFGLKEK